MRKPHLAVLGATGVVGREILSILIEENVEYESIKFLASSRSAGKEIEFKGQKYIVEEATPESFEGVNIVLASAGGSTSLALAKEAVKRGAVYIDNSSAFRMEKDVPLVIAGVNDDDLKWHKGIVANPNCSTSQLMLVLKPLHDYAKIKQMFVSTYQAVSGAGIEGIYELSEQMETIVNKKIDMTKHNEELPHSKFKYQIAYNVIPAIGGFNEMGFSSEEMKLQNEGRKIMHLPEMKVCCTCVRVPVMRSHAISINLTTENKLSLDQIRKALSEADGVTYLDDPNAELYPMPLNTSDQDKVFVGRLREDPVYDNGIALWCCGDQIRKGAATNAIQIAELFI